MVSLALPVIAAELGWMAMGVVDTRDGRPARRRRTRRHRHRQHPVHRRRRVRHGPAARAGHDRLAGVRGRRSWRVRSLARRRPVARACSPRCRWRGAGGGAACGLPAFGLPSRRCCHTSQAYFPIVALSLPPLLVYAALRRYLQALSRVGAIAFTLVSANLVNVRRELGPDLRHRARSRSSACAARRGRRCCRACTWSRCLRWVAWRLHRGAPSTHACRGPSRRRACGACWCSACPPPHT